MSKTPEKDQWIRLAGESVDPSGAVQGMERIWETLDSASREKFNGNPEALRRLTCFLAASPAMNPFLIRHTDRLNRLFLHGAVEARGLPDDEKAAFFDECKLSPSNESLSRCIARFRNTHLVRLYAQEILSLRPPQEIWLDWSGIVSYCIQGALEGCRLALPAEAGDVEMCVVGMGKLGGGDLNYASDIDVMFLYDHDENVDPITARETAIRWAERITRALEAVTEEGPSFRVDHGLRPGGKDGALVNTLEAAELYYQSQAVTWERLALIKVRPVAGDVRLGEAFVEMTRPFVFRRYLDYGALQDIRTLKERIQREVLLQQSGPTDVKMGRGGIRELEFFVQTVQIIYGGRRSSLRSLGSLSTLEALKNEGMVTKQEYQALRDAYLFLRGVEHRIQMVHHRQTHKLPEDDRELTRIAGLMGYRGKGGVEAFEAALHVHMDRVHEIFEGLLTSSTEASQPSGVSRAELLLVGLEEEASATALIKQAGFEQAEAVRESLQRMIGGAFPASRSPRSRDILRRLLPKILPLILETPHADQTLFRIERFFEAIGSKGGYYALLEENPGTLGHLITILGESAMLARWLPVHLEAVEVLIDRGHYSPRKTKEELSDELHKHLHGSRDQEERLGRLRLFRAQEILRIGVADLWQVLDPLEIGEELTALAEVILEETLTEVLRAAKHDPNTPPFCILGLGSFGGRELSYQSDLDMIFIYQGKDKKGPSGDAYREQDLTRIGQRLISWMTMPMREGQGWSVDLRLRPSGSRGPLLVSLESYGRYYHEHARSWERQVLLKARPCGGDPETGRRTLETIGEVLSRTASPDPLEFHKMRLRMEEERTQVIPPDGLHLKLGSGGIADLDFLLQYHQLANWAADPAFRVPYTRDIIKRLFETGVLSGEEARFLLDTHRFFKGVENRLGLVLDHKGTDQPCTKGHIDSIGSLMDLPRAPEHAAGESLHQLLTRVMQRVREIYLRHLAGKGGQKRVNR